MLGVPAVRMPVRGNAVYEKSGTLKGMVAVALQTAGCEGTEIQTANLPRQAVREIWKCIEQRGDEHIAGNAAYGIEVNVHADAPSDSPGFSPKRAAPSVCDKSSSPARVVKRAALAARFDALPARRKLERNAAGLLGWPVLKLLLQHALLIKILKPALGIIFGFQPVVSWTVIDPPEFLLRIEGIGIQRLDAA
jgi:hypothetical protein